ncbi:hypothetical protein MKEN_01389400 [Mycena kentingensis (nom. inval.)]|nr:hypothetical protein MKEN_01389400 [Mycena kentingensis (nom. inval.)]
MQLTKILLVGASATVARAAAAHLFSRADCVFCPQVVPECPECKPGSVCQITPQTCTTCASASCVAEECIICPQVIPQCPPCPKGQVCIIKPQTCTACASASCVAATTSLGNASRGTADT